MHSRTVLYTNKWRYHRDSASILDIFGGQFIDPVAERGIRTNAGEVQEQTGEGTMMTHRTQRPVSLPTLKIF